MRHCTVALSLALLATPAFSQPSAGAEVAVDAQQAEKTGFDYWLGRGVKQDAAEAARWLEQAASAGRPYAAAALAGLYRAGQGVPRDPVRAHELSVRAAAHGIASAQAALGFDASMAPRDVRAREVAAALPWLNAAAEQEDSFALFLLGQMYRFDEQMERDVELGRRLIVRAAELGYPPAGMEAASFLLPRSDSPADVSRGLHFLRSAAAAGFGPGLYELGLLYLTGTHVERDVEAAAARFQRASELGVRSATLWLAELHAKGLGVPADAARAAELRAGALPAATTRERNELAWDLAVSAHPDLRNGTFAVELMEAVTAEAPSAIYIDTLAAAYAEAGRFDDAMLAQQRAIDALSGNVSDAVRRDYQDRLELYRSRQPYREAR